MNTVLFQSQIVSILNMFKCSLFFYQKYCICILFLSNMSEIDKATKGSVVQINYTSEKGLQLKWNTKGMLLSNHNNTVRHLFILKKSEFSEAQDFMNTYYAKMRLGDLIGILRPSSKGKNYKISWLQKSNVITDIKPYIKQKYMVQQNIINILEKAVKAFQNTTELVFINIFPLSKAKDIQNFVKGIRYEGVDNIIFNIFERTYLYDHYANTVEGINSWNYPKKESMAKVISSMKLFTNLITLSRITIRIQSLNGSLISQNTCNWYNIDFSTIQKVYYGVFADECSESLYFLSQEGLYSFTLDLIVYLNYRITSGKQVTCSKKITLTNDNSKLYQRTHSNHIEGLKEFYLYKDKTLVSNFAKRQAIIWVSQVKQVIKGSDFFS